MESQAYSWAWVTIDQLVSHGPCELVFAYLVASAAETDSHLYDGENTNGDKIVTLESNSKRGHAFSPKRPVYCRRGLFVDVGSQTTGIFVQWRELPNQGAEQPTTSPPGE